jgi:heptosyltransferase I
MRASGFHRALDFFLGVPFVLFLSIIRRKREIPDRIQRIGFIAPSAIGDLVLDSGVLVHVREKYPDAAIHLFVGKNNSQLVPLLPITCVVHVCDFFNVFQTTGEIRAASLDVLVDFAPWPRLTAICARLSGVVTVGFRSLKQFRHFAFDVAIEHRNDCHETENLLRLSRVFGDCNRYVVALRPPGNHKILGAGGLSDCIICHCVPGGSRARYKMWPQERWVHFSREMISRGYKLLFSGSTDDSDYVQEIVSAVRRTDGVTAGSIWSECGHLSLTELAQALVNSRLCVSVDTGVMHLAWALGVPTVALMGPASAERWGAKSEASVNVESRHPSAGFIHLGFEKCRCADEIMSFIDVQSVCNAAFRLLGS